MILNRDTGSQAAVLTANASVYTCDDGVSAPLRYYDEKVFVLILQIIASQCLTKNSFINVSVSECVGSLTDRQTDG